MEISNSHIKTRYSGGKNVYISTEVTSRRKVLLDTINNEHRDDGSVHEINKQRHSLTA